MNREQEPSVSENIPLLASFHKEVPVSVGTGPQSLNDNSENGLQELGKAVETGDSAKVIHNAQVLSDSAKASESLKRDNAPELELETDEIEDASVSKRRKTDPSEDSAHQTLEDAEILKGCGHDNSKEAKTAELSGQGHDLSWTDIASDLLCQDFSGQLSKSECELAEKDSVSVGHNATDVESSHTNDRAHVIDDVDEAMFRADYTATPRHVTGSKTAFSSSEQNYLRGSKWSPDGSCILTNSGDNRLRVFNLPEDFFTGKFDQLSELTQEVNILDGELVYDFSWYPGMTIADPLTCCFVTTSRDHPMHMWDSLTGQLRCSYRAFDHLDELTSAYSLAFSNDGQLLYSGFEKMIRVFDISRPGRDCQSRPTFMKMGQSGIISCIATNPSMRSIYAAGSYSRSVAVYSEPKGDMMCMFEGHVGGVTHLKFSLDGTKLFSGGRKDHEILCWDVRHAARVLYTMQRKVTTNQRIYFDFDSTGRYLMSGNQDGTVSIWDTLVPPTPLNGSEPVLQPMATFAAHNETVNSLSCHPTLPAIVTGSGQRHFKISGLSDSEDSDTENSVCDNSIKVWWFSKAAAL